MNENPKPKKQQQEVKSGYQPSKAELDADISIKTTPEELALAVVGRHPRRPQ